MHQVTLRPIRIEDAEPMVLAMRPADLGNFLFFEQQLTLERQREWLREKMASRHDRVFVIEYDGQMVGTCGIHEIDWHNHNARLGAMIFSSAFRGKKIGSEAIRQLIAEGFEVLGLYKLYLKVFAENTASATKYAHLGFQFEARLRGQYCLRGVFHDMVVMSMFREEWEKSNDAAR
jgi:diamine N-acetyltransferase